MPLTFRSAQKIRQVVQAMEMEKEGAVFDWDNIRKNGVIPMDTTNWSRLRPDLKAIAELYNVSHIEALKLLMAQEKGNESAND